MTLIEFLDERGRSPFAGWFDDLETAKAYWASYKRRRKENE